MCERISITQVICILTGKYIFKIHFGEGEELIRDSDAILCHVLEEEPKYINTLQERISPHKMLVSRT